MGLGERDVKNKEASASASEGGDNLKRNEAMFNLASWLATKATVEEGSGAGAGSGAGKKKTRLVRLKQELIDEMMSMPFEHAPTIPEERLAKHSERFRACYAEKRAITERIMAFEKNVIEQYLAKGYAEAEEEVIDNEVEVEN